MDDIFSDPKDETEKEDDSNIEWKKSGIDKHERLTLKINVKEANLYNAAKANDLKAKIKPKKALEVPKGFKKISKKIRDSFDEEEDEEDYILVPVFEDTRESSLMRALSEDEKKILQQNENINNIRMQENAGKEAAIERAEKVIMQAGLGQANNKVLDEKRLKAGKLSVDEVVTEAVKQKTSKKPKAESKNPRREESKARAAAKDIAKSRDEESQKAAAKLNAAQAKAKEQTEQKQENKPEEPKPAPEKVKQTEAVQEELSSIKADEKAAVERPEAEIAAVREEKAEPAQVSNDKVNEDEINKTEPTKDEPVKEEKTQEPITKPAAEKQDTKSRNDEIIKENAKEIVAEKEKEKQPQPENGKEKDQEIKEMIMEKSGRTYNDRRPQKKIDQTKLSEKEYQKALEAQIKMYQDRER